MNLLHKLRLRFRALFQKEKLDARMDDEMRSHIEMQTQENIEAGMKPEEARYAALRQFGWVESIKETSREQRGLSRIENLGQDVRYGARMLRSSRTAIRNVQRARPSVCVSAAAVAIRLRFAMRCSPHSASPAHSPRSPTRRPKSESTC